MFETLSMEGPEFAPVSGGKPRQLVLFLHGVGADGNDLISLAPEFADVLPDAHFISVNAPFHCDMAPMGRQWFSLQKRDSASLLTGINTIRPMLNEFIDNKLAQFNLTIDQLFVVGFSQGTMTALHTMLTRDKACAGVIGYSGAIISSSTFINEITAKPPVCLIHGEEDDIVFFAAMADAEAALLKAGIDVEVHPQPNLGHSINLPGITAAKLFMQKVMITSNV